MGHSKIDFAKAGENIRRHREAKGIKQEWLGRKVKLNKSEISRIEKRQKKYVFKKFTSDCGYFGNRSFSIFFIKWGCNKIRGGCSHQACGVCSTKCPNEINLQDFQHCNGTKQIHHAAL